MMRSILLVLVFGFKLLSAEFNFDEYMSWRRKVHKTERNEANGVPCQDGRITIALDCSIGLSTNNFQKQINFLINDIFTYQWTNLERLTIIQKNSDCDELPFARKFSSEHTIENVDRYVKHAIQFGNPDLVQLLQQIDEHQTEFSSDIVHLIVFVSQINDTMETTAKPLVQSLMLKNYELTFVALGSNLNSSLFLDLSPNLIEWPIETNLEPKDWSQKFQEAYGCVTQTTTQSTPTSLPPSTSPSTFSTRKPQSEYLPCAGNLYIRLDNSLSLDERVLWTQISFVGRTLFSNLFNHYERLLIFYNERGNNLSFNFTSQTTAQEVDTSTSMIVRNPQDNFLDDALNNAIDIVSAGNLNQSTTVIVFFSLVNESKMNDVEWSINQLESMKVRLVLVSLDPQITRSWMQELVEDPAAVSVWQPPNFPEPLLYKEWLKGSMLCEPDQLFTPCGTYDRQQINIFVDYSSADLTVDEFQTILSFLKNQLFNDWDQFERLMLTFCTFECESWILPGTVHNLIGLQQTIDVKGNQQGTSNSSMSSVIQNWIDGDDGSQLLEIAYFHQNFIYFTASFTETDEKVLIDYLPQLNGNLTVVALKDVNQTRIQSMGLEIIDWSNLNQTSPVDWKQGFWKAYGCELLN